MPGSIVRTGDGRVTPRHVGGRRTIVRHDRRRVMVLNGFVEEVIYDNPPEAYGQVDPRTFRLPHRLRPPARCHTATGSA